MRRWLDPEWYRYLWSRVSVDVRVVAGFVALLGAGLGGFFALQALNANASQGTAAYVPLTQTLKRVVSTREHGHVIVRQVTVVRRLFAKPVTVMRTRVEATSGGTVVVKQAVVQYKPVYRSRVVFVHGKPVTVKKVVTDSRMLTETAQLTVTNDHTSTVVQNNVVTNTATVSRTLTQAQTVTEPGQTVVRTVTETQTLTQPSQTQTVTVTGPTVTVTVPITVTTGH